MFLLWRDCKIILWTRIWKCQKYQTMVSWRWKVQIQKINGLNNCQYSQSVISNFGTSNTYWRNPRLAKKKKKKKSKGKKHCRFSFLFSSNPGAELNVAWVKSPAVSDFEDNSFTVVFAKSRIWHISTLETMLHAYTPRKSKERTASSNRNTPRRTRFVRSRHNETHCFNSAGEHLFGQGRLVRNEKWQAQRYCTAVSMQKVHNVTFKVEVPHIAPLHWHWYILYIKRSSNNARSHHFYSLRNEMLLERTDVL